ncbi:putative tail-fiber/lysozyme protein [Acinetobacter phage Ab65]|nr:putative tail-fiber/lysozyme protein [Acinetobacter phage Ab31]WMC00551.1 putative tail-fiber/lysozyme protein [Acinetobacter phage Ab59]WMC00601.1 putative tail-fiber/lysozyme protein [Acinetobacter phage Ab65]
MAENIVESIIVKLGLDGSQYNREAEKAKSNNDKLNKSVSETDKIVGNVTKTLARWFSVAAAATGILKMVDQVQKLNDELYHLERNLGMSASTIKNWQGAAGAMGGSAQGMTESIKSLNMGMNDFVTMGDTTLLPFMNALGVGMVDAQGKLRKTDDVMLDLADSFSKMDREQAFSIASKMGIDEGTFNTLVQGRKEMEKMLEYQSKMYKSSEEELKASRQLAQNRALLGQHWESLKTMMANAIIPLFVKLSEVALGIFEYLQENQQAVQAVFKGISFVIGAILIPILVKATVAALAFMAPFAPFILVVGALGAAFGLLYDDYKTWAEGGKSLFDWGAFRKYIDDSTLSVDNLKNAFSNLGKDMLNNAIPTLKGYAEILDKLVSGDFKGAASQAWDMLKNYYSRAADFVDDLTGQKQGTLANAASNLINRDNEPKPLPANRNISSGSSNNAILDLIAQGEVSTTAASGYNVPYRGARISAKQMFGKELSQLTIGEVKQLQKANINEQKSRGIPANRRSSAMGRYQFIYSGFDDYIRAAGLSDKDLFSPENQDAMAMAMIRKGKYGLDAVRAGKATPEDFQNKVLAARWASIQKTTGGGVHDAAGFNKATIGSSAVAKAISSMRQNDYIDLTKSQQNKAIANKANEVQVNIGDINIQTSASTVSGNVNEAMGAVKDNFYQLRPSTN